MVNTKMFIIFFSSLIAIALALYYFGGLNNSNGTQPAESFIIAAVSAGGPYQNAVAGFIQGLKAFGKIENQNLKVLRIETASPDEVKNALTKALKEQKIDLIFSVTTAVTQGASQATRDIPIVFAVVGAPVESGFIKSFADPGGNLTGCSNNAGQLSAKRLELFKNAFGGKAKSLRFIFFYNPSTPISKTSREVIMDAALKLGVTLRPVTTSSKAELESALSLLSPGQFDGMINAPDSIFANNFDIIVKRTDELKIPVMVHQDDLLAKGATISYGANIYDEGARCASIADKILGGTKPGKIPVEAPPGLELIVNQKKANEIGFTMAPDFLYIANSIIK